MADVSIGTAYEDGPVMVTVTRRMRKVDFTDHGHNVDIDISDIYGRSPGYLAGVCVNIDDLAEVVRNIPSLREKLGIAPPNPITDDVLVFRDEEFNHMYCRIGDTDDFTSEQEVTVTPKDWHDYGGHRDLVVLLRKGDIQ